MGKEKNKYAILRQWTMLKMLSKHTKKTSATLEAALKQEGFDVSRRTVQRDLLQISQWGSFPLGFDKKSKTEYEWYWDENASALDLPGMDPNSALILFMAEEYLGKVLPQSIFELIHPKAEKAEAVLGTLALDHYRNWPDKVRTISRSQPLLPPRIEPEVLETVYDALLRGKKLEAIYKPSGKPEKKYLLNPHGLIIAEPRIYLLATVEGFDNILHFFLHRFISVTGLNQKAKVDNFDIDHHIQSGALGYRESGPETYKLRLKFYGTAGDHLLESPLCIDQTDNEAEYRNGSELIIQATVPNTKQLRTWLASFGGDVEVLAPSAVREDMVKMAQKMSNRYKD